MVYSSRVEGIVQSGNFDLNLQPLRVSVHSLQNASHSLDVEKLKAVKDLNKAVRKWNKWHSKHRKALRKLKAIYCRIRKALGHECKCPHRRNAAHQTEDPGQSHHSEVAAKFRVGRPPAYLMEQSQRDEDDVVYAVAVYAGFTGLRGTFDSERFTGRPHHGPPIRELRQAVRRVLAVNKKLKSFEQGFISVDGIKDREWYKHLVVAPGKWLGT